MDLIDGKHTQLLALFSNPSGPTKLKLDVSLQPLKFGQEMKFLLRAIPPVYLELLPAATLHDVAEAVQASCLPAPMVLRPACGASPPSAAPSSSRAPATARRRTARASCSSRATPSWARSPSRMRAAGSRRRRARRRSATFSSRPSRRISPTLPRISIRHRLDPSPLALDCPGDAPGAGGAGRRAGRLAAVRLPQLVREPGPRPRHHRAVRRPRPARHLLVVGHRGHRGARVRAGLLRLPRARAADGAGLGRRRAAPAAHRAGVQGGVRSLPPGGLPLR